MKKIVCLIVLFVALGVVNTLAQTRSISGTVTSAEDNSPLPGVAIMVKGTNTGSTSDVDGAYKIEVPAGATMLEFSFIGMKTTVEEIGNRTVINVALEPDVYSVDEVVVTALGIPKEKKALGYAVGEVNSQQILDSRETNVINSLSGLVAGVQVNNSSGMAGSSARITIRGTTSLNYENQPLIIVDGIPFDNTEYNFDEDDVDYALLYGNKGNTGIDIDPNQIENMTVLKGAAASALYGSRAANGVILITTKGSLNGGKAQGLKVNISSRYGWENIIKPPVQKKYGLGFNGEYYDGENDKTYYIWGPLLDTMDIPTYDQFDEFFETGQNWENSFNVQGGGEKGSYFASYSNLDQKGTVPKNTLNRHNLMARFSARLSDRLSIEAKMGYIRTVNDRIMEGNNLESVMWTIINAPVTYNFQPAVDENGVQRLHRTLSRNNHFWTIENVLLTNSRDRFTPNVGLDYKINSWLNFTGKVGVDYYTDFTNYHENVGTIGANPTGRIDQTTRTNREFNSDLMLNFNKSIGTDFNISAMVGQNINDRYYDYHRVNGSDLIIPDFYDLSNATSYSPSEGQTQKRTVSIYGQGSVAWRSMLFLNVTGRNDWSSSLPVKNNSYFYPSVSLSYIFTEMFNIPDNILPFGKIRLSYAQVGNDPPAYATKTSNIRANPSDGQRGNIDFPFRGYGSYIESNVMGNPDLKPELTSEMEMGLDLRFLNNRIGIDMALYSKKSTNQIFPAPIASETGFLQKVINAGEITNKGVELMVDLIPVKFRDFTWNIKVNYSRNKNEVVKLTEGVESIRLAGFTSPGIFIREKTPYGVIWGTRYERNEQGQVLIDDDPESDLYGFPIIADDLGPIGIVTPDWQGGIRNSFSYKGITLSALVDMRKGGDLMNFDEYYTTFYGSSIQTENRDQPVIAEGVNASDGTKNDIELSAFDYYTILPTLADEFMVQKSDFIKLREVSFSYRMPAKFFSKTPLKEVSVVFTGRNLWMKTDKSFTGSDPELSLYGSNNGQGFLNYQMPASKSYSLTLNVGF
ncbi:MAG: SusC/RagA family TonB-linked outer membrane protein [Bacteroidales bacterium]|nr:SusC/RagA family TonB-linked outer membrane protein [Bacteroidales bacterium]